MKGHRAIAVVGALTLAAVMVMAPAVASPQTREEAVALARDGKTREAIAALRKLLAENPSDQLVAFDLAVILTWASRSREATDTFEEAGGAEPPEYVLGPVIRAYRDQKRFAEAERWAREAVQHYSSDATWKKLLALVLADRGRTKEAIETLTPLAAANPDDAEVWLALGYASLRAGDYAAARRNYGEALRLQPKNREAARAIVDLKAASLRLRADEAAALIRRGESFAPRDPRRRFDLTDVALERLKNLLREVRSTPNPDRELSVRLRRDQVKALRNRERWAEAVAAAEKLRADGDELPPYVIEAEADALLALRQPEKARALYETVIRAEPANRNPRIGRFFCLVEEENFTEAFREIDALVARDGSLESNVLAARARSFADMRQAAWQMLLPLVEINPKDAQLRSIEGNLAAARGWPRRSDDEIHFAANLAPEDRGVQLTLAKTAIRRMRWDEARERIAELVEIYPDDVAVRRAERDIRLHETFELRADFLYHHEESNSNGAIAGSAPGSGTEARVWLFSPPLDDHWRFIGAWERSDAKVTEGTALRYREGAGLELELPDVTATIMGWQNDGSLSQPGADAAVTWQPTDHWVFALDGSYFAADTPLRAVLNQITANSAGGSVRYAWHESRSLRFYARFYDFSDGNRREAAGLMFNQKIVDIPHLDVTLRPELYASENSSNAGPYFSPLRDFSGSLTIDAEHVLWRRYERSLGHRLALTVGSYWQENFGNNWTGNILYEQVWQNSPWCELRWGAQFRSAVYDGDRTPSIDTFIRFNWRF
jgi:biofilm PGA synthesis protein PgaA